MIETLLKRETWREVFARLWRTTAVGSVFGMLLIVTGGWIAPRLNKLMPGPRIEVVSLSFHDGRFWQQVRAVGAPVITGSWTAGINADDDFICSGGGKAPYYRRTAPVDFTPSEWTGGNCAGLINGRTYTARAEWEWLDNDGLVRRVSREITFVWHPETRP